jgi:hypothetical protein
MKEYWALVRASDPELAELNTDKDFFNAEEKAELEALKAKFATKETTDGF